MWVVALWSVKCVLWLSARAYAELLRDSDLFVALFCGIHFLGVDCNQVDSWLFGIANATNTIAYAVVWDQLPSNPLKAS